MKLAHGTPCPRSQCKRCGHPSPARSPGQGLRTGQWDSPESLEQAGAVGACPCGAALGSSPAPWTAWPGPPPSLPHSTLCTRLLLSKSACHTFPVATSAFLVRRVHVSGTQILATSFTVELLMGMPMCFPVGETEAQICASRVSSLLLRHLYGPHS